MPGPARGMIPADLFRLIVASDAQISPDGRRVAFVRTQMSEEKDAYLSAIWIAEIESGALRPFTAGPKRDTAPRWSPDGRWLAFLSERPGNGKHAKRPQLYVMPVDGGEPRRLTDLPGGAGTPVWSPDGRRIAFAARVPPPEESEQQETKPGEDPPSKPPRVITALKYKANGEGFIYDRRRHIFVVPADGSAEPLQITDGDWDDGQPSWSPDGTTLAFASARHEERDYDLAADIWVVSSEGGEPRRLTRTEGPASNPAWSPDGTLIAYTGDDHRLDMGRNTKVYVVPATGGEPRCLTATLDRSASSIFGALGPEWSPDSRWIYFGVEDQGNVPVLRVDRDGTTIERVLAGDRQIASLSVGPGELLAFTASDPVNPAELFVRAADGTERQLTDFNRALKEEVEFVRPERFRFTRAGLEIDGWVMKPAGYQPGRRYPTLLNIHGGPAAQYGHNFFDEFQVQAGAGYAVVFFNPRGSQGYGESFTRAVRGDWGGGDFLDLMHGLDLALARYDFLDPERLGVLGGSYGGFMTSWTVGHTDRFKAACSERAVNNTYTLFGTSDIGSFFSETQAGVTPWDHRDWYIEHSPLTYAPNIHTPLLILHSEQDLRCPIEQAEELFVVLKKLRRTVKFVRFPDENHELSRSGRPRHRRQRFEIILDWFATYLQPERSGEAARETAGAAT
jgi:dipeptidyl aminopeptidase/acylaminoacyl peptidase